MKSIKKMITLILALLTVLSTAVPAFAASNTTEPVNLQEIWFPAQTMNITQVGFENASHGGQNSTNVMDLPTRMAGLSLMVFALTMSRALQIC